jgi:hypothetical protein
MTFPKYIHQESLLHSQGKGVYGILTDKQVQAIARFDEKSSSMPDRRVYFIAKNLFSPIPYTGVAHENKMTVWSDK